MGFPRCSIVEALRLMANLSWSSVVAEEGHAYAISILKQHRQYTEEALRQRAMVAPASPLVAASKAEKRNELLEKRIARIYKQTPT